MNIFIWILIWYGAFAGYYALFKKKDILYKNSPGTIAGWYVVATLIGVVVYFDPLKMVLAGTSIKMLLIGIAIVLVAGFIWRMLLVRRSYVDKETSKNIFASKTAEIIFQQVMIWALAGMLLESSMGGDFVGLFTVIFFIIHIPLLFVLSMKKGTAFVVASIVGGLVFGFCIVYIPGGWLFALALHIAFYAVIASQKTIFGMSSFYNM